MTDMPQAAPQGPAAPSCAPAAPPCAVGKNHPPEHSRWRKGRSGNPRTAQPPLAIRTAVIERVLAREIDVLVAGQATVMPLGEAVFMRLTERAVSGEATAMTELVRLMGEAEKQRVEELKRRSERSRQYIERRRAREAERAAAEDEWDDADGLVESVLYALDVVVEGADGEARLRPWVLDAARARAPERWAGLKPELRDFIETCVEPDGEVGP